MAKDFNKTDWPQSKYTPAKKNTTAPFPQSGEPKSSVPKPTAQVKKGGSKDGRSYYGK